MAYDPKSWWAFDIDMYFRLRNLSEKYPNNEDLRKRLVDKRAKMVELYGATAMKGI